MTSRLLSQIVIDGDGDFRVWVDHMGGPTEGTATIPDGTYYWSCDGTAAPPPVLANDFAAAMVAAMTAVYDNTWLVDIVGVDVTSSSHAEGRLAIVGADDWEIRWTHGATTLPPRICGEDGTADKGDAGGDTYYSTWLHRYGYYPQTDPEEDLVAYKATLARSITTARVVDTIDDGEYETIGLLFAQVGAVFVRIKASDTNRATPWYVNVGDLNAAWERFCLDVARNGLLWRYYPDSTGSATYEGPYGLAPGPQANGDPLVGCSLQERGGELWRVSTEGMEVT